MVTRLADFGAFVEIEPGIEGLIHISEMSYNRKLRHPSDLLRAGDRVESVILAIKPEERRISLGMKQTLTDPWSEVKRNFPVGSQIEGPVTKLMNFGAFVQLAEGVEGLVHVSEISAEKRINHPSDVLRAGQIVKARCSRSIGKAPDQAQHEAAHSHQYRRVYCRACGWGYGNRARGRSLACFHADPVGRRDSRHLSCVGNASRSDDS